MNKHELKFDFIYLNYFLYNNQNPAYRRINSVIELYKKIKLNGLVISSCLKPKSMNILLGKAKFRFYPNIFILFLSRIGFDINYYYKQLALYKPRFIILYNYPSFLSFFILIYCKFNNIKVLFDLTEIPITTNLFKYIDIKFRLFLSIKFSHGIIVVSNFMKNIFLKKKYSYPILVLPPMIVRYSNHDIYSKNNFYDNTKINFIYSGNPGKNKDDLKNIILSIENSTFKNNIFFRVFGITKLAFLKENKSILKNVNNISIHFYGKVKYKVLRNHLIKSDFQIIFRQNNILNNSGFPTKLVDSFQFYLPVISTRTSDISLYIKNSYNGFLFDFTTDSLTLLINKIGNLNRNEIYQLKNNIKSEKVFYINNYLSNLTKFTYNIGI